MYEQGAPANQQVSSSDKLARQGCSDCNFSADGPGRSKLLSAMASAANLRDMEMIVPRARCLGETHPLLWKALSWALAEHQTQPAGCFSNGIDIGRELGKLSRRDETRRTRHETELAVHQKDDVISVDRGANPVNKSRILRILAYYSMFPIRLRDRVCRK